MKEKDRLNLIDEYIKATQILNFLVFMDKKAIIELKAKDKCKELTLLALKVKKLYEEMFIILNMNDLSMKVLLKDLEDVDYDTFAKSIDVSKKIEDYAMILNMLNNQARNYLLKISGIGKVDIL